MVADVFGISFLFVLSIEEKLMYINKDILVLFRVYFYTTNVT